MPIDQFQVAQIPVNTMREQVLCNPKIAMSLGRIVREMIRENDEDGLRRVLGTYGVSVVVEGIIDTRLE